MKTLAIYALEVLACSGVLLAAYAILLDRRVRFGWCRAYLLASTLLAAVIPLLRIPVWPGEVVEVAPTVALARDRMDRRSGRRGGSGRHARNGVPDGVPDRGRTGRGGHAVAGRAHPPAAARRGDHPAQSVSRSCAPRSGSRRSRSSVRSTSGTRSRPGELQAIVAHEASHVAHRHSAERVAMECMKAALWWNPFVWLGRTAAHRSRGVRSRQRRAGRRVRHRTLHENHIQAAIRL